MAHAYQKTDRAGDGVAKSDTAYSLIFLVIFVAVLSFLVFSRQSLRLDEAQSLWQTSHSLPAMISIIGEDVHVPLYHTILHFWQLFLGNEVATARMLSLFFFMLALPAMYLLGSLSYNSRVATFATALMAISPFLNWYGNEIRMYSLFALLTIINQYFFVSIFMRKGEAPESRSGIWLGYAATLVLGMFTHYFFALTIIAQAIFFLSYRHVFQRQTLRTFLVTAMMVAVMFAPWIYFVSTLGSAENTKPNLAEPTTIDLFNTFSQFIFGFQNDHINTILVSLWPILVLLVFLALRRHRRIEPQTMYLLFSLFIPIIIVFTVSLWYRPIYLTRYLILTLPSLYLLISWVISTYPRRLAQTVQAVLIVGMSVTLAIEIANANTPVKEDYRAASIYLTEQTNPQDIIVVSAPFTVYPIEYYYRGSASIETIPHWDRLKRGAIPEFSEERLPEQVEDIARSHERLWLLLSYDQGYEEDIRLYFDNNFERIEARNFSQGLNMYVYRLRYE